MNGSTAAFHFIVEEKFAKVIVLYLLYEVQGRVAKVTLRPKYLLGKPKYE